MSKTPLYSRSPRNTAAEVVMAQPTRTGSGARASNRASAGPQSAAQALHVTAATTGGATTATQTSLGAESGSDAC